jgi:hypothetical protein
MTLDELLPRLDNVRPRANGRYSARCPAHADTNPSLQVTAGDNAVLLRCWSGCSLKEICDGLGINQQNLFYDACDPDPHKRREAAQRRDRERQQQEAAARKQGRRIDALRAADYHIRSRHGLDISGWSNQKLDDELNLLADAFALLASEECDG